MSRDLKHGLLMLAGGCAGWLVGRIVLPGHGWEITCLVIGIAAAQFLGRRLFPEAHGPSHRPDDKP